jgi:flagellar M-ring protein FliF
MIKSQLLRIQQQLSGLSASQKMLVAALVTIMVMTMLYWARYAGTAEMEALLDQPFSSDEIARVTAKLASRGIRYQVSGDRVMVPSDRKYEALADLSYEQLLPRNTETGFDIIAKQINAFMPNSQVQAMYVQAKQITLARVIGNYPGVSSATVLIDPKDEVRLGKNSISPTAMVTIQTRGGERFDVKRLVAASADAVVGAQAGLQRKNITVIIDGRSYPVQDREDDSVLAGDQLEWKYQSEHLMEDKIREQFSYIQGLIASVTVDVNIRSEQAQEVIVDKNNFLYKETSISNRTEEGSSASRGIADVGASANTQISIDGGAGGDNTTSTTSEDKTQFTLIPSQKTISSRTPAGKPTVVGASVRVPRSYFVRMYKTLHTASTGEPSDAQLKDVMDNELASIRDGIKKCTGLKDDTDVSVATYADVTPDLAMAAAQTTAVSSPVTMMLGGHVKEIGVGVLAVVSLLMVMMMVRKGAPVPVVAAAADEPVLPQMLSAGEHLAGEAGEGDPALDGMELDEDAVRAQQMLGQVSTLVKENPEAAANLVKRWLNRT